jgi:hypothetical protein
MKRTINEAVDFLKSEDTEKKVRKIHSNNEQIEGINLDGFKRTIKYHYVLYCLFHNLEIDYSFLYKNVNDDFKHSSCFTSCIFRNYDFSASSIVYLKLSEVCNRIFAEFLVTGQHHIIYFIQGTHETILKTANNLVKLFPNTYFNNDEIGLLEIVLYDNKPKNKDYLFEKYKSQVKRHEIINDLKDHFDCEEDVYFYYLFFSHGVKDNDVEILKKIPLIFHNFNLPLFDFSTFPKILGKNWENKLLTISEYEHRHYRLTSDLVSKYPVDFIHDTIKELLKIEKKDGIEVIGKLEAQSDKYLLTDPARIDYKQLKIDYEKDRVFEDLELCERLKIDQSKLIGGWKVYQLCTKYELKEEGRYQNHCVGGYNDKVERGISKIFSFRKGEIRWTVEYCRSQGFLNTWHIVQSQGKYRIHKNGYTPYDARCIDYNEKYVEKILNEQKVSYAEF